MQKQFELEIVDLIPHLRKKAFGLCRCQSEADDLVQDTVEKALIKIDLYEEGTNLKGWLSTILVNKFKDKYRQKVRRGFHESIDEFHNKFSSPAVQEHNLELNDTERKIASLSEDQRNVIEMIAINGFSYEQAAEKLNLAVGTVRSRLSRARSALRNDVLA